MNKKIILILISLTLLSASCNPFSKPTFSGIVKTVNGGGDWQFFNVMKDSSSSLQGVNISKIAFSPENSEIVYASSYTSGLFKSEDSGSTWKQILSKISIYDFAVSEYDSKTIYVAGFYGGFGKLLRTTDGGASWLEIYNEQGSENPVRAISINPQNPNNLIIGTASGGIIKSADGGNSWKVLKNFEDRTQRVIWQNSGLYVLLKGKGFFKATGTLETFENLSDDLTQQYNLNNFTYNGQAVSEFNQAYVDPVASNLMYITSDKGLFKSVNGGKDWQQISLPIKQGSSYARGITVSRTSSNIVYTSVGSTIYKSLDAGLNWQTQSIPTNGLINFIAIDPKLPQIVYAGIYVSK